MAKREENYESEIKDKLDKTIVNDQSIVEQMEKSFMDYAMSVIVARALPDVRDGLKPVHRRILYAMNELNITHDKPYKKSARIVGEVMGKYHPHGDASIYDAMVRMAQDFSIRYELIDGHGNFGSIDGDKPAAMRYTEARLTKISGELLRDIEKETVRFIPNYDESESEPSVLPAHFPNLLVNGTSGIAVGMATNIPPHNLVEVINALVELIEKPESELSDLMENLIGPDFPTSAIILGDSGIRSAYETGRGSISIRAKAEINYLNSGKAEIIINELPYMVNKANLIEKIAQLVQLKEIEGIADLRDESSREGIRIFIETKKTAVAEVVLNRLYKLTALQTSFGINMVVIDDGEPKLMNLKQTLVSYLNHQIEILKKATQFDLEKAEKRAHILIGLEISISNIDKTIAIIRNSKSNEEAGQKLRAEYQLDEVQSKAILDMRLGRLTALEQDKIKADLVNTRKIISKYREILESEETQKNIIKSDLIRIKEEYGDERRTAIDASLSANIDDESLIPKERIVITISREGYLKRINLDEYHSQRRGGVGVKGANTYEEDVVDQIVVSHTHEDNLFFTSYGKVYRVKGYQIPRFSRQAKGIPIINLLPLEKKERVNAIIPIIENSSKKYLFFATKKGIVKKTALSEYHSIRQNGKIAIKLRSNDELLMVKTTSGNCEIFLGASNSRVVRFNESDVRSTGRQTSGVLGINLKDGRFQQEVVGIATSEEGNLILAMGLLGNGKVTKFTEYRKTRRGSKGVKTINTKNRKVGKLVAIRAVNGNENLLVMTNEGLIIRFPIDQIRETGRNASGVKLVNLRDQQFIQDVSVIRQNIEEETNNFEDEQ